MNYLPSDKQFLLLWFKNFIEIESRTIEEDTKEEENINIKSVPLESSYSVHLPNLEDAHNMGIVVDPRFEGTT